MKYLKTFESYSDDIQKDLQDELQGQTQLEDIDDDDIQSQEDTNEEDKLAYIASLIRQEMTSGYHPYWSINYEIFKDGFEMGDADYDHVASQVADGVTEGELVITNQKGKESRGWWKIEIGN
jgi:hypothetical protein